MPNGKYEFDCCWCIHLLREDGSGYCRRHRIAISTHNNGPFEHRVCKSLELSDRYFDSSQPIDPIRTVESLKRFLGTVPEGALVWHSPYLPEKPIIREHRREKSLPTLKDYAGTEVGVAAAAHTVRRPIFYRN